MIHRCSKQKTGRTFQTNGFVCHTVPSSIPCCFHTSDKKTPIWWCEIVTYFALHHFLLFLLSRFFFASFQMSSTGCKQSALGRPSAFSLLLSIANSACAQLMQSWWSYLPNICVVKIISWHYWYGGNMHTHKMYSVQKAYSFQQGPSKLPLRWNKCMHAPTSTAEFSLHMLQMRNMKSP